MPNWVREKSRLKLARGSMRYSTVGAPEQPVQGSGRSRRLIANQSRIPPPAKPLQHWFLASPHRQTWQKGREAPILSTLHSLVTTLPHQPQREVLPSAAAPLPPLLCPLQTLHPSCVFAIARRHGCAEGFAPLRPDPFAEPFHPSCQTDSPTGLLLDTGRLGKSGLAICFGHASAITTISFLLSRERNRLPNTSEEEVSLFSLDTRIRNQPDQIFRESVVKQIRFNLPNVNGFAALFTVAHRVI